jgi:DinB superfamily
MPLYKSLFNRLSTQHEAIAYIIAKTSFANLNRHPAPGKWSAQDNIAHLAKYQPVFIDRMNLILIQDNPVFERYTAESDPDFEAWRAKPTATLLKTLETDRQHLLDLITSLDEEQLHRIGVHKRFGKLSIIDWTEFFLLHEAHHLFTIFQLVNEQEVQPR